MQILPGAVPGAHNLTVNMRSENECEPHQRYLFAGACFSDKAIAAWQAECMERCRHRQKGGAYDRYINWTRKENEIAVFTLYAYADFDIPKKFDLIFHLDNPKEFLKVNYQLTQSIHEAWFPIDEVGHGHKHLCVFSFEGALPGILNTLHKEDTRFSTAPGGQKSLGFCNSKDFEAIKERIEKKLV